MLIKPPPKEGMDVLVFEEEEVEEEDEMRPATTTVEDDAASVVNIFCSCCVKRGVLCDVFLRMLLFLVFCCFIDDISTKVAFAALFLPNFVCVALFLGALKNHLRRRTEEKAKRAHANLKRH